MNAMEQARERRLAAGVAEVLHGAPIEELTERIAARLAAQPAPTRHPSRGRLWAAALVLLGVGVAGAVGRLSRSRDDAFAASTQDPQPAQPHKVTNADCKGATITKQFTGTEAHEALMSIARLAGVPVVVSGQVEGKVTLDAKDFPWREALEQAAAAAGGKVQEYGNVVLVAAGSPATRPGARLKLRSPRMSFEAFAMAAATTANANVVIAPGVGGDLDVDLDRVPWHSALDAAAAAIGAEITGTGDVLVIQRRTDIKRTRMAVNFTGTSADQAFDTLAKISSLNLIIAPGVNGQLTVQTNGKEVLLLDMVRAMAAAVGAEVHEEGRGLLRVAPMSAMAATHLILSGETITVHQLGEFSKQRGAWDMGVTDADGRTMWVFAQTAGAGDLWHAVALATGRKLITDAKQWRLE